MSTNGACSQFQKGHSNLARGHMSVIKIPQVARVRSRKWVFDSSAVNYGVTNNLLTGKMRLQQWTAQAKNKVCRLLSRENIIKGDETLFH